MSGKATRIRRAPEAPSKRSGWKKLRSLLALALLVEVAAALRFSPAFAIREVRVEGIRLTTPTQVIQAARVADGSNWLLLHRAQISRRLEQVPTIAEAVVSYGMPGKVKIRVFERQPVASLRTADRAYWVDELGVPFWQSDGSVVMPTIRVEAPLKVVLGRPITNASVKSALEIIGRYLPEYPLPVAEITIDREGNLCLNMKGGLPPVRLGDGTALADKMILTAELWTQSQVVQQAEYFDVSCVEKPVWKPREGAKGAL